MKRYDDDEIDEDELDEDEEEEEEYDEDDLDDLDDDDDDDEEDDESMAAPLRKPRKKSAVSPPAPTEEEDLDDPDDDLEDDLEDDLDEEFDEEIKKRRDKQVVDNFLNKRKNKEASSVSTITDLLLQGESDKIVHELSSYCSGNNEIKKAKQLLREARDRAKARIVRLAGVASLTLDELKDEYEDS